MGTQRRYFDVCSRAETVKEALFKITTDDLDQQLEENISNIENKFQKLQLEKTVLHKGYMKAFVHHR